MEAHIVSYPTAADPSSWLNRVVAKSADNAVALHNSGSTPCLGVVTGYRTDGTTHSVSVCVAGPAWVVAGETTLNAAGSPYVRGGDDSGGATLDGRAVAAAAGEHYVGRVIHAVDVTAGGLCPIMVAPGQLAQAGT